MLPERSEYESRNRGLAIGIVGFFAILIIAALLYIMLNPAATEIHTLLSDQTTNQEASDHIDLLIGSIWAAILFYTLFVAVLFIVARSVFESRRPG